MFRHCPRCSQGSVSRTRRWSFANRALDAGSDSTSEQGSSCGSFPHSSEIRAELVARVRRAIAEGRYETPEKWEAALELLSRRLRDI